MYSDTYLKLMFFPKCQTKDANCCMVRACLEPSTGGPCDTSPRPQAGPEDEGSEESASESRKAMDQMG